MDLKKGSCMKKLYIVLLSSSIIVGAEMPRTKLSHLQSKFNQRIANANNERVEKELCGILQEIISNPVSRKPDVALWLDKAYSQLDEKLKRPSICSRVPQVAQPAAPLPQRPLAPAQPQQGIAPMPRKPQPSAPELPTQEPISQIPREPMPSAPELPQPAQQPQQPLAPALPREIEPIQIQIPAVVRPEEVDVQKIFHTINNIITKNKFTDPHAWSLEDQQALHEFITQAQPHRELANLISAYFKDYKIVTSPKDRAKMAVQAEQALNHLYNPGGVSIDAVQRAQELILKLGARDTAFAFNNWPVIQRELQPRELPPQMADILGDNKEKVRVALGEKEELDKIKHWNVEISSPIIYKDPQVLNNLLKEIREAQFTSPQGITGQKDLTAQIQKKLTELQNRTDQQIIDEVFGYLVGQIEEHPQEFRTLIFTLIRMLKEAAQNEEATKKLQQLIQIAREQGEAQTLELLKEEMRKKAPKDLLEGGQRFPRAREIQLYDIPLEERTIQKKER